MTKKDLIFLNKIKAERIRLFLTADLTDCLRKKTAELTLAFC